VTVALFTQTSKNIASVMMPALSSLNRTKNHHAITVCAFSQHTGIPESEAGSLTFVKLDTEQ